MTWRTSTSRCNWLAALVVAAIALVAVVLAEGTRRNPQFWLSADQKGERLESERRLVEAAGSYSDPWRIGVAHYRNGDFEKAAHSFARVPGAVGAYNQGNAWLMRGRYDAAIASYERALGFRPGWKEAEDNRALALARQKLMAAAGKNAAGESTDQSKPDDIVFDQKGGDQKGKPLELGEQDVSDEALRARWLRHVRTTPADFLRTKFAYQAARGGNR